MKDNIARKKKAGRVPSKRGKHLQKECEFRICSLCVGSCCCFRATEARRVVRVIISSGCIGIVATSGLAVGCIPVAVH